MTLFRFPSTDTVTDRACIFKIYKLSEVVPPPGGSGGGGRELEAVVGVDLCVDEELRKGDFSF